MQEMRLDEMRLQYPEVNKAFWYAVRAHKGQIRKDGKTPYIMHPVEVAEITGGMTKDPRVISAALLHDVVEDTPVKIHDLIRVFGVYIADLVADETENKRRGLPPEESWETRKKEMIVRIGSASKEAKMISLADKLSNLRSIRKAMQESGEDVRQWFHQSNPKKQAWFYRTMGQQYVGLKSTAAWKQYDTLLKEVFGAEGTNAVSSAKKA